MKIFRWMVLGWVGSLAILIGGFYLWYEIRWAVFTDGAKKGAEIGERHYQCFKTAPTAEQIQRAEHFVNDIYTEPCEVLRMMETGR